MKTLLTLALLSNVSCTSKTTQDMQKSIGHPLSVPATMTAHILNRDTVATSTIKNSSPMVERYLTKSNLSLVGCGIVCLETSQMFYLLRVAVVPTLAATIALICNQRLFKVLLYNSDWF